MSRTVVLLIVVYLAAITAANLIVTEVGPQASVYTALGFVALDLVLRDVLHDRLAGWRRWAVMGALAVVGGLIAYALNADAGRIAVASAAAFAAALAADAAAYHLARFLPWVERSSISNAAGAVVDSAVFVAIAFPGFLWDVFIGQTTAKIAGGLVFALLLERVVRVGVYRRA